MIEKSFAALEDRETLEERAVNRIKAAINFAPNSVTRVLIIENPFIKYLSPGHLVYRSIICNGERVSSNARLHLCCANLIQVNAGNF